MGTAVSVEEVVGGKARVRFAELPSALHGDDPRYAWPATAWERYRIDPYRNPYFEEGEAALFLARRLGRPAGRISAHVDGPGGEGRFGFWCAIGDLGVAQALVDAAEGWLAARGCTSMTGPTSFTAHEEEGLLVEGFDVPGLTGRPWHPPSQARLLEDLGLEPVARRPTWRLATTPEGPARPLADDVPGHAGRHGDPRLALQGVAAVPDVSGALRHASLRGAWDLARRARSGEWTTATVVRCEDDPARAVPALLAAAGRAGYAQVVAPWSPDPDVPPEAVHQTYRWSW